MKYFVVADVHGYYDLMVAALHEAHFEPKSPNHCLISLGDAIDRGPQPLEVIRFFMSLPNKILIRGNHEDLVQELLNNRKVDAYDKTNGTFDTIIKIAEEEKHYKISEALANISWENEVLSYAKLSRTWKDYYAATINYAEIGKFIFVHGWIPFEWQKVSKFDKTKAPRYKKNWRTTTDERYWEDSRWLGGIFGLQHYVTEPDKVIVCGHWTVSDFHKIIERDPKGDDNFTTFVSKDCIACDGCTAYSGEINVVVIENNEVKNIVNFRKNKDGK